MKFSIIVPVYNVERFLEKCLDSILNQDYSDYEIVAVNDGSQDNSANILERYKEKTDKLQVIYQENKGLGGARNTGIKNAKGEYLFFLDSDDYIDMYTLSTLTKYLEINNLDILAFDCMRVDENGNVFETVSVNEYKQEYTLLSKKEFLLFEPTSCTKIYRRELFVNNGIEFPERLWYEDLATIYKTVPFAKNIGYLKKAFYYYVQQSNSITHSVNTIRMLEIIKAFESEVHFYKQNNLFEKYYAELEWNCALHVLYYSAYRLLTCGYNKKEMQELYKYSKSLFPNIESNIYVLRKKKSRDLMELVMNRRYFLFYLKTGFMIKCVRVLKPIVKLVKKK